MHTNSMDILVAVSPVCWGMREGEWWRVWGRVLPLCSQVRRGQGGGGQTDIGSPDLSLQVTMLFHCTFLNVGTASSARAPKLTSAA